MEFPNLTMVTQGVCHTPLSLLFHYLHISNVHFSIHSIAFVIHFKIFPNILQLYWVYGWINTKITLFIQSASREILKEQQNAVVETIWLNQTNIQWSGGEFGGKHLKTGLQVKKPGRPHYSSPVSGCCELLSRNRDYFLSLASSPCTRAM